LKLPIFLHVKDPRGAIVFVGYVGQYHKIF